MARSLNSAVYHGLWQAVIRWFSAASAGVDY
jgi:hypothetical protein